MESNILLKVFIQFHVFNFFEIKKRSSRKSLNPLYFPRNKYFNSPNLAKMNETRYPFELDSAFLSDTVHHQQGGTCYAHATATVLASVERRIEGRVPQDHWTIVSEITTKFGSNGASIDRVLEDECKKRQLKFRKIIEIEEAKNCLKKRYALAADFTLKESQWDNLCQFLKREPQNILTWKHLRAPSASSSKKELRSHAVVIGGYDEKENCWIIKNSWGKDSGYYGYWRVSVDYGLKFHYYNIFFSAEDLTDVEIFNYIIKYGSDKEIHSEVLKRGKIEEFQVRFFAMEYQSLPEKVYSILKSLVNYIKNFVISLRN